MRAVVLATVLLLPAAAGAQVEVSHRDETRIERAIERVNAAVLRAGLKLELAAGGLWLIYAISPTPGPVPVLGLLLLTAQGLLELHWASQDATPPLLPAPDCSWFLGEDFPTYSARTGGGIFAWLDYWQQGTACQQGALP